MAVRDLRHCREIKTSTAVLLSEEDRKYEGLFVRVISIPATLARQ